MGHLLIEYEVTGPNHLGAPLGSKTAAHPLLKNGPTTFHDIHVALVAETAKPLCGGVVGRVLLQSDGREKHLSRLDRRTVGRLRQQAGKEQQLPFDHDTGERSFRHAHWNWNIRESFFFPGADQVFMDAEDVAVLGAGSFPRLTEVGQEQTYVIDLQEIFELARDGADRLGFDEPLPATADIPILGVHWAVEVAGETTRLAVSLEAMQMLD